MASTSRIPRFYELSVAERRRALETRLGLSDGVLATALAAPALGSRWADQLVENVVGTYELPFCVQMNLEVNGESRFAPMVVEEPSVVAAASNAARIVRSAGGFSAEVPESLMIGQVELRSVANVQRARSAIEDATEELCRAGNLTIPGIVRRGGGVRDIEVRELGDGYLIAHILVDCCDAMGANLVNTVAERLGPELARLSEGVLGLRILSNLTDRRRVSARCRAKADDLAVLGQEGKVLVPGEQVIDEIALASQFAERDPYRAATHNKGLMNGVDSVVLATGNDFRAVEAGAHAFAARSGQYAPLATWRRDGNMLCGELDIPLAVGIVGGMLAVHPTARTALTICEVKSADDLAILAACTGLASNLAALRALSTEGIQRGHMSLHAKSVAVAAGAQADEVGRVANEMVARGTVTVSAAAILLEHFRCSEDLLNDPNG